MGNLNWKVFRRTAEVGALGATPPGSVTLISREPMPGFEGGEEDWHPGGAVAAAIWGAMLIFAVGFRAWGLTWGGGRTDLNPDEWLILRTASHMSWADLNPHFYNYSGFIFHVSFLTNEALKLAGVVLDDLGRLMMHRLWSVFWGTATVVLLYHVTRAVGGSRRAGYLAAGFMAILPLHVWESHYGTTDAPLLFWLMASLLASIRAYDDPRWRWAVVAGILTGFATGTKYPGAFGVVPFAAAVALAAHDRCLPAWRDGVSRLGVFAVAALAGSVLVSPFLYVDAADTVKTFLFEYRNVGQGHFGFDLNQPGWQYHPYVYELGAAFPFGFGVALYLVTLPAVVMFTWRAAGKKLIPLAFGAVYFGVTGSWRFVPVRYFMPLFPIAIVATGWFLDRLLRRRPAVAVATILIVFGYTTAFTASTTHRFTNDTRIQAATWGNQWLAPGSQVLMAHTRSRFAYVPRLDTEKFRSHIVNLRDLRRRARDYRGQLGKGGPGAPTVYVCASGLDFLRYYRSGEPASIESWDALRASPAVYKPIKSFEAHFLNKAFYRWLDPMFESYFVSPRIEFYEFIP